MYVFYNLWKKTCISHLTYFNFVVSAFFDHSYNRNLLPAPFILGTNIHERQLAGKTPPPTNNSKSKSYTGSYICIGGFFTLSSTGNFGNGTSNNSLSYVDTAGNTYSRNVNAALNVITFDQQSGSLAPITSTPNTRQPPINQPLELERAEVRFPRFRSRVNSGTIASTATTIAS